MSDRLTEAELLDLAAWMRHLRETWPRDVCEAPLAYVKIATVEALIAEIQELRAHEKPAVDVPLCVCPLCRTERMSP